MTGDISSFRRGDISSFRRGACPTLAAPMQTGDGLLVRLTPRDGEMTMAQLAALALAAGCHGNGLLEITMRGALQIRGLTAVSAGLLAADVVATNLDVRQGLAIDINALASIDPEEILDPRPLARMIAAGVIDRGLALGPKVSVTIDSGGQFGLAGLKADIQLRATMSDRALSGQPETADRSEFAQNKEPHGVPRWLMLLNLANREQRAFSGDEASMANAALDMLATLSAMGMKARMPNVPAAVADKVCAHLPPAPLPATTGATNPVGVFSTTGGPAIGLTPPYGATDSATLVQLAQAFPDARVRLAPERGLLLLGLTDKQRAALPEIADRLGLICRPDDIRLRIAVCAGAPQCASAAIATRALADELATKHSAVLAAEVAPGQQLHVSGCEKRCGAPSRQTQALDIPEGAAVIAPALPAVAAPKPTDSAPSYLSQLSQVLHTLVARHARDAA